MWSISLFAIAILTICITHWVYSWKNPKCRNGKLPPGSMGMPLLGETLQFFSNYSSNDFSPFIKQRMERHGPIFLTSLVGRPVVVSTDQEFNNFIFQQEGKLFQLWYMDSFMKIFGKHSLLALQGYIHKYLRNLILTLLGPQTLKEKLLSEMEQATVKQLQLWSTEASIDLKEAAAKMIFNLAAKKLISYDEAKFSEKLRENFADFRQGLISFPLNVPGTPFYKCLQGRKKAMTLIKNILDERRISSSPAKHHGDFLDLVLEELKKDDTILTEDMILHLIFVLIFATYESTSTSIALTMKFITDHPSVLEELTKEHEGILQKREKMDSRITWEEYKSMTFTSMVINESIRLGNPAPLILRKTMTDIHIKGYTIPAGWAVMICPPVAHLDPAKFSDPLTFNPWRWKGIESNPGKNFMGFGGGARSCVGSDFAKLQMSIFLHHLVTKYRCNIIKGGDILRDPGVKFPDGFHVQFLENHK